MEYNKYTLDNDKRDTYKVWKNLSEQREKELNATFKSTESNAEKDNLLPLKSSLNLLQTVYSFNSPEAFTLGISSELEGYNHIVEYFKGRTGRERSEVNVSYLSDMHDRLIEIALQDNLSQNDSALCQKLICRLTHPVLGLI